MTKSYRLNFGKGVNVVGDKAILPEGFMTIQDNVDLRSGSMRPFKAPEYQFSVPSDTVRSWSYRGRWLHTSYWADYAGEFIGGLERIYKTAYGRYASKIVAGIEASLGTPRPLTVLGVIATSDTSPSALVATVTYTGAGNLADGERVYRVAARTKDGILPPCPPVSVTIADTAHAGASVNLTWGQVPKAIGYIIFEGTQTAQYRLDEVTAASTAYADTGAKSASGDGASQYLQEQEFQYAYSYVRNVNGAFDESGLSALSVPVSAATGRLVTRDYQNDGFMAMTLPSGATAMVDTVATIPATSAASYPPLSLTAATGIAATAMVANKRYKILTLGVGTDYTLYGSDSNAVGTYFTATGAGLGTGTVDQITAYHNGFTNITTFYSVAHGLVTGDKAQFKGFTDPRWLDQTYDIVYVNDNAFAVEGIGLPTDGESLAAGRTVQPVKSTVNYTPIVGKTAVATDDVIYIYNADPATQAISGLYKATKVDADTFTVPLLATTALTNLEITYSPANNYYWRWNIYRNEQGIWNLVQEMKLEETSFQDALPYSALGGTPTSFYSENGISVDYDIPPFSLTGIESHYGMKFAIAGHSVRWTPPLVPDAWPEVLSVTLPYQPVALASFSQGLIILCEDAIYRLDGNQATAMSLSRTHAEDGCFAPHTVQKTDKGLVYLSKRGVMLFDGTHSVCLTDTKVPGYSLTSPSTLATAYPFWWMPTTLTKFYSDLGGEDALYGSSYKFTLDNTQTIDGYTADIKSFYHQGKYYLFYSGANYAGNTALCIDFQIDGFPITTLGMKILDAHVNETEQAFILCDNSSSMTVSFTVALAGG